MLSASFATNGGSIKRDHLLNFELQSDIVIGNSLGRLKISHRSIIPGQTFTSKVFGLTLTPESCTRDFKHIRTISVSFLMYCIVLYCIVEVFDKGAINCLFTIVLDDLSLERKVSGYAGLFAWVLIILPQIPEITGGK